MRDLCDRLGIFIETRTHAVSACSADAVVPVGVQYAMYLLQARWCFDRSRLVREGGIGL